MRHLSGVTIGLLAAAALTTPGSQAVAQYGFGAPFDQTYDVAVDASGDLVVVASVASNGDRYGVFRVDPATGDRTVISNDDVGSGPSLIFAVGVAVEASGDLVVVCHYDSDSGAGEVLRIDRVSGDRTVVSDSFIGTGPILLVPVGIAVESSGDLVVTDGSSIVRVDPVTGDRTVVSNSTTGAGPSILGGAAIAVEASGSIVLADGGGAIVRIDPTTGDRVILSGGGNGTGPSFDSPAGIALEASGALVVADGGLRAVIRVDPVTGDRTVISDAGAGSGPVFDAPFRVAVATSGSLVVTDPKLGSAEGLGPLYRVDPVTGDRAILSLWACPDVPPSSCDLPSKSILLIKDSPDKLLWKSINGPAEAQSAFGDPTTTAAYELCIYQDGSLSMQAGVVGSGTCEGKPCWRKVRSKGYRFKERTAVQDGVSHVVLTGHADEPKTKILLKGKGSGLPIDHSTLPLPDSTVAVRLINSDNANCWGADFPTSSVRKNTGAVFKAKTP